MPSVAVRDESTGRWLPGRSGNPAGKPRNESAAMMREALAERLTKEKAVKIADRLIYQAMRGNVEARGQLFRFLGLFDDTFKADVTLQVAGFNQILAMVYGPGPGDDASLPPGQQVLDAGDGGLLADDDLDGDLEEDDGEEDSED